jgi:hypothetical protein
MELLSSHLKLLKRTIRPLLILKRRRRRRKKRKTRWVVTKFRKIAIVRMLILTSLRQGRTSRIYKILIWMTLPSLLMLRSTVTMLMMGSSKNLRRRRRPSTTAVMRILEMTMWSLLTNELNLHFS